MQGETLFTTSYAWQDPRFSNPPFWTYNEPQEYMMDTQSFAPGNHPAHFHYAAGHQMPQAGVASQPYHPQSQGVDIWKAFNRQSAYRGPFSAQEASLHHGRALMSGYAAQQALPTGFALNTGPAIQSLRPSTMIPYGYGSFPQPPLPTNRAIPSNSNEHGAVGSGSPCNHCQSAAAAGSQAARSPQFAFPTPMPALARGPPRKPKRSGHAVWVGNIPMGASIEALKDHFSRDATRDIESVFLMAKSNCAFVNYHTEEACNAAVERFNHSLFGSVRLLCRIRREPGMAREVTVSTDASSTSSSPLSSMKEERQSLSETMDIVSEDLAGLGIKHEDGDTKADVPALSTTAASTKPADRYFIVKSLTKEDLQNSLQTGAWETQPHNQKIFDNAFREAENVFMIFSVNKSGEYFGYARMLSSPHGPITPNQVTTSPHPKQSDTLKVTETAATATAPRGCIIDDTVRGTLFWEAEHETNGIVSSTPSTTSSVEHDGHMRSRPFQVEWLSVRRVTFQRTKGIRNPWNNNKEVKVARDGTELETEIGQKIVALFHESYEDMIKRTV